MLCSGGGGRADYGGLKYFHTFWPSDNTDPAKRVFIQWGFSHFFPACALCNHVTRMGQRPVKFALDVAMSGDLGFDVDLAKTSAADLAAMKSAIQLFKDELRVIVEQGDLYRLESPYDGPRACLDYVAPDRSKAVIFVYQLKDDEARARKAPRPGSRATLRGARSQFAGGRQFNNGRKWTNRRRRHADEWRPQTLLPPSLLKRGH